jgi:ribonuclease HI
MKKITIFTDGGSRNNPGMAGAGVFIMDENGKELKKVKKFLGIQTNNWAEYEALILGLETAKKLLGEKTKSTEVEIKMDSELIVKQLNGQYRVKEPSLFQQFVKVNNLKINFPNISFNHIPRAQNKEADKLANQAMDEGV